MRDWEEHSRERSSTHKAQEVGEVGKGAPWCWGPVHTGPGRFWGLV